MLLVRNLATDRDTWSLPCLNALTEWAGYQDDDQCPLFFSMNYVFAGETDGGFLASFDVGNL